MPIYARVEPDQVSFERVIHALDSEGDGKRLQAQLAHDLHQIMEPAASEAKSNVMSIQTGGSIHEGEPLRPAIAAGVKTYVQLGEKKVVVGIEADQIQTRGFVNAPKRFNESRGWRHPVFGSDRWVTQRGAPGWFDKPIQRRQAQLKKAVQKALQDVADRISRKA